MIWDLLQAFTIVRARQHFHADDVIDKLNRSVTVIFLIISMLLVSARQLVGPVINCIKDQTVISTISLSYIENVCWAKNTYLLKDYRHNSTAIQITYYQWLPFILLFLAFCYYIPYLIWKSLLKPTCTHNKMPIDVSGVINMLKDSKLYKQKEFNSTVKDVVDYLNNCFISNSFEYRHAVRSGLIVDTDFDVNGRINLIKLNDNYQKLSKSSSNGKLCCLQPARLSCQGSSLIFKYLLVKIIYITISISMFWFINLFLNLDSGFSLYGYQILKRLFIDRNLTHDELWNSHQFPRIVYCDLGVHFDEKNVHKYMFQCSLPANVFFEKIFIFLWFWFLIVAVLNCYSLLKWIYLILTRKKLIKSYLNLTQMNSSFLRFDRNESRLVNLFINNYLQYDGLLVLLIIKSNLDDIHFKRLIDYLWKIYSISNLDDQDLMQPTPPRHTSTININGKQHSDKKDLNMTSPLVVPQQPSAIIGDKNGKNRKKFFNQDNLSESEIQLIDSDKIVNNDSDYFNNETQQQQQPARRQPTGAMPKTFTGYRKEELV